MTFVERWAALPPSGGGGCHGALLGCANVGVRDGLDDDQIFAGFRAAVYGGRDVPDKEIEDAIKTARRDTGRSKRDRRPGPAIKPGFGEHLASLSPTATLETIIAASPIRLPADPAEQARTFFKRMFDPREFIYAGPEIVKPAEQKRHIYPAGRLAEMATPPACKFIVNPLTGEKAYTHSGTDSYRGDNAVADLRYLLLEADGATLDMQTRMWATIVRRGLLDLAAITHSGGKSLHGIVRVGGCGSLTEWRRTIHHSFYPRIAEPLGIDPACKNPARFSRTPGAREEGRGVQWLLYLA